MNPLPHPSSSAVVVFCILLIAPIYFFFSHSPSFLFSSSFTIAPPPLLHNNAQQLGSTLNLTTGANFSATFDPTGVTQVSWRPRVFMYSKFLTDEECGHLINLAREKLEKSMVLEDETGDSIESDVRTSYGMFLQKAQDEVVAGIEARISAWTFLPIENGELLQVRYEHDQKYEPHHDFFVDKINLEFGGNRVATVLIYLSDVEKGGETVFPDSEAKDSQHKDDSWSDCAKLGYAVKSKKGNAILFYNLHPNKTLDLASYHGSCPVIKGEKWSATKWIHERPFEETEEEPRGDCFDKSEYCPAWVEDGECELNPVYMVGSEHAPGACRKSCKAC